MPALGTTRTEAQRRRMREYMRRKRANFTLEEREQYLARARISAAKTRARPERKEYIKGYLKEYYQNNREKYWRYRGIDIDTTVYDQLLVDQEHKCAICRQPERAQGKRKRQWLSVDHDHTTGRVRGLLCYRCNLAIGNMRDDPELFLAAIAYLRKVST